MWEKTWTQVLDVVRVTEQLVRDCELNRFSMSCCHLYRSNLTAPLVSLPNTKKKHTKSERASDDDSDSEIVKCYPIIVRRFQKTLHVCLDSKVKWYRHLSGANRVKFLDSFKLTRAIRLLFCSRFWNNFMARDDEYDYLFKGQFDGTPDRGSLSSRWIFSGPHRWFRCGQE